MADRDRARSQTIHARSRAHLHYGLRLSLGDVEQMASWVRRRSKAATFVCFGHSGREIWKVLRSGRHLPVVYDPATGALATVLGPQCLRKLLRRRSPGELAVERHTRALEDVARMLIAVVSGRSASLDGTRASTRKGRASGASGGA